MDHARKIGKRKSSSSSSTITTTTTRSSEVWTKPRRTCKTNLTCKTTTTLENPIKEDHRLANWRRWLSDRQRRQKHLSSVLKREPLDLALNAHEKVRARNEKRCIMQAAVRPEVTNQDRYRGNPAFWNGVVRLTKEDDVVGYVDRDRRNLPPEIDRVALPDFIKREKMLVESCMDASKIDLASKWECGDYLRQRKSELSKELKFLEVKEPETKDLAIIGKNFQCNDEKPNFIRVPVITITPPEIKKQLLHNPDDRVAMKIQQREFVLEKTRYYERLSLGDSRKLQETLEDKNAKKYAYSLFEFDRVYHILPKRNAESITWSLIFVSTDNERCTRHLVLENRGVYVVKMHWRTEPSNFCKLPFPIAERLDSPFYFNKNHLTILPGQKMEVPIWFRSNRPVVASETWKLVFEPKIYPGDLYLRLWGTSDGKRWKDEVKADYERIKTRLRIRVRNSAVRQAVDEIVRRATTGDRQTNEDIPYQWYFLESEVFRARNPGYHYRSILINELKDMFEECTGCRADRWNLSLASLREILLKLDDDYEVRRKKLERFRDLCFESLRPVTLYERSYCSKEQIVRWLLRGLFNQFEEESELVMRTLGLAMDSSDYGEGEGESVGSSDFCLARREDLEMYHEVFYLRIYDLLRETLDKISATVESDDRLNKRLFI